VSPNKPQHILLPVRSSTIVASFAIALLLAFLPWPDLRYIPDFVALVLLGVGWLIGLVTDAGNGVLLGQHALAYALLAFFAITLSRRILWFSPWYQALHVAPLLLLAEAVVIVVRLAAGAALPGWPIVVGPLVGAALWPLLSWLLLLPQRRALEAGLL
jgi:rod shape-determining protein MreD